MLPVIGGIRHPAVEERPIEQSVPCDLASSRCPAKDRRAPALAGTSAWLGAAAENAVGLFFDAGIRLQRSDQQVTHPHFGARLVMPAWGDAVRRNNAEAALTPSKPPGHSERNLGNGVVGEWSEQGKPMSDQALHGALRRG